MSKRPPSLRDRQADAVRREIVDAARRLFNEKGYAGTSMVDIATAVGVAIQTIYTNVGGKPAILMALLEVVDESADVTGIRRSIGVATDAREVLRLASRLRRLLMEKAGDIVKTLGAAAPSNPDVAKAWTEGENRTRKGAERIAHKLNELRALRPGIDVRAAADILYAELAPAIYLRLVAECGWTADRFEEWQADAFARLLLPAR